MIGVLTGTRIAAKKGLMQHHAVKVLVLLLATSATCALAQTAPPIKPGLWELHSEREVDGQKTADPKDELKKMRPEARKQLEAVMREKGMDVGGGPVKVCMSREVLDQGQWQGQQSGCKTEITSRSATTWKWRTHCDKPQATGDGEAVFSSPEAYTVKSTMKSTVEGKTRTTRTTAQGRWVGADCGTLPPMKVPEK
jgi:hypothetical protein